MALRSFNYHGNDGKYRLRIGILLTGELVYRYFFVSFGFASFAPSAVATIRRTQTYLW